MIPLKVITFKFNGVVLPGLPAALNVTLAKIMLPLVPAMFHAVISTMPRVLLAVQAITVESGLLETLVT